MSNLKCKSATGAELLERVTNSDAETEIYWDWYSSDESANPSSDEMSSDSDVSDSDSDDVVDVRVWYHVDTEQPRHLQHRRVFDSLETPDYKSQVAMIRWLIFLDDDVIDTIVRQTNWYAEQTNTWTPKVTNKTLGASHCRWYYMAFLRHTCAPGSCQKVTAALALNHATVSFLWLYCM